MELVLVSLVLLFLGGAVSVFYKDEPRASSAIGAGSCVAGCLLAFIAALRVLFAGRPSNPIRFPSNVPLMEFVLHLDALSAVFLLPILGVSAIAAVYGSQYVLHYPPRAVASIWFFFNLLVGNLILVICAHNAIMFLIAWEVASIAPFFLLAAQHDQPHVRRAAIRYVIAMHIGSAALIAAFLLLAGATNSFDFDALGQSPHHHSSAIFGLLLIGFGMKAGLVPLHVWLPEAHPAAPSHASAVMSGAVINIGVYGIVRFLSLLGGGPLWWSVALIGIGLCTAVFGVLFALGQPELKRLLAYSSIENMGIITASFGLSFLAARYEQPMIAYLAFAGAVILMYSHAISKCGLFLSAGVLRDETGTTSINVLGGMRRHAPYLAGAFLFFSSALCGLAPLTGFLAEIMLLTAAFRAALSPFQPLFLAGALFAALVVFVAGLAALLAAGTFSAIFLGTPRKAITPPPGDPAGLIRGALALSVALTLLLLVACPLIIRVLPSPLEIATGSPSYSAGLGVAFAEELFQAIGATVAALLVSIGIVVAARALLLSRRSSGFADSRSTATRRGPVWSFGFQALTPRMQYNSLSFAQSIIRLFTPIMRPRRDLLALSEVFPPSPRFRIEIPEVLIEHLYRPAFRRCEHALTSLRVLQPASSQGYAGWIMISLLVLLAYSFLSGEIRL